MTLRRTDSLWKTRPVCSHGLLMIPMVPGGRPPALRRVARASKMAESQNDEGDADMPNKRYISIDGALRRVNVARFGEEWVSELTDQDHEVLEGGPLDFPGEYDPVKRRAERGERQYQWGEEWLYEHCFTKKQRTKWDCGPYKPDRPRGHDFRFDCNKLEQLLASQFPLSVEGKQDPPAADDGPSVAAKSQQPASTCNRGSNVAGAKKAWRAKPSAKLSPSETSVLEALNSLWPDGDLDHKARARDQRIGEWLKSKNKSPLSSRTIQRARQKIRFA